MAVEKIFDDEYFNKIDALCWIVKPDYYDRIHKVIGDIDTYLTLYPKSWSDPWYKKEHFVSAKDAVKLIKNGVYKHFGYWQGVETASTAKAMWALKEAAGIPYFKHWIELIEVYYNSDKPLVCDGKKQVFHNGILVDQSWHYDVANAVLELTPNENLLRENEIVKETDGIFNSVKSVREYYGQFAH